MLCKRINFLEEYFVYVKEDGVNICFTGLIYIFSFLVYTALCGYPHVKVSIRELNQISTTAPIFQQYNYFRQNSEENVTFTFYFFSFASNFPYKVLWDNNNIDANICIF